MHIETEHADKQYSNEEWQRCAATTASNQIYFGTVCQLFHSNLDLWNCWIETESTFMLRKNIVKVRADERSTQSWRASDWIEFLAAFQTYLAGVGGIHQIKLCFFISWTMEADSRFFVQRDNAP